LERLVVREPDTVEIGSKKGGGMSLLWGWWKGRAGGVGASAGDVEMRRKTAWIGVAAELAGLVAREGDDGAERARGLLAEFLRGEMDAVEVRYVPVGLAGAVGWVVGGRVVLGMGGCGEVADVVLRRAGAWGAEEIRLAEVAAKTAGGVLEALGAMEELRRQSMTDALTGLYNRRSLDRMLEREVLLASRHGGPLSVVVIDVDHFKLANDRFGHSVGDALLRHVGATILETLRRSDLAFRYGGDEFVVVLPQTGVSNATAAMEKLRRAMAAGEPGGAAAGLLAPTLSIGVAEWWAGGSGEELVKAADEALYGAKRANRNCVRAYRAAA